MVGQVPAIDRRLRSRSHAGRGIADGTRPVERRNAQASESPMEPRPDRLLGGRLHRRRGSTP